MVIERKISINIFKIQTHYNMVKTDKFLLGFLDMHCPSLASILGKLCSFIGFMTTKIWGKIRQSDSPECRPKHMANCSCKCTPTHQRYILHSIKPENVTLLVTCNYSYQSSRDRAFANFYSPPCVCFPVITFKCLGSHIILIV